MKNRAVIMESVSNASFRECALPELKPDQVLIRNFYTVVSAGTERAWSMDMPNAHSNFPYTPGYSGSGEVVKVGSDVTRVKVGDRVVVNWGGHQLYSVKPENLVVIPEPVSMLDAAFAHIASFSFNGVRKLHLEIGESAMVAGQGILGVFALQVALLCGAVPMIVSDFSPERRALAMKLGADYALNPGDKDYLDQIREITDGEGVRAIVEVTGSAAALQQALEYVAWEGRIALLGCTRVSDVPIDFYKYVHRRGIQLFGAHTHSRAKLESAPYHWTEQDDYRAFLKLVANGKIKASPIISEIVSPQKAHEIYRMLAEEKNPPMGIVFDWTTLA